MESEDEGFHADRSLTAIMMKRLWEPTCQAMGCSTFYRNALRPHPVVLEYNAKDTPNKCLRGRMVAKRSVCFGIPFANYPMFP